MRALIRRLYAFFYSLRTAHEEREVPLMVLEIGVILVGLTAFAHEALEEWRKHEGIGSRFFMEHKHDLVEVLMFILLGFFVMSHEVIRHRRKRLGYDFRPVLSVRDRHGHIDYDSVFHRMQSAPWGFAPAERPQSGITIFTLAEAVAAASAGILSERSLGHEDNIWFTRERDYLVEWLRAFKAAIWLLPDAPAAGGPQPSGYASVIVPITEASGRSIRRGHRATDTAELDPCFLAHFRQGSGQGPRAQFLAYVQVCVSDVKQIEGQKLLTASVQHLVALLHGRFGADGDFRARWQFSVLCESANERQVQLLEGLGFHRLAATALDKERAHRNPAHSFAGFPLLELQVEDGQPGEAERLIEAERFLACLEEMVRRYALDSGVATLSSDLPSAAMPNLASIAAPASISTAAPR